jgi:hypothetical protein
LPSYRVLTGPDDDAFCWRVSEALELGYQLYGSPGVAFDGDRVIVAQAALAVALALGFCEGQNRSHALSQRGLLALRRV